MGFFSESGSKELKVKVGLVYSIGVRFMELAHTLSVILILSIVFHYFTNVNSKSHRRGIIFCGLELGSGRYYASFFFVRNS